MKGLRSTIKKKSKIFLFNVLKKASKILIYYKNWKRKSYIIKIMSNLNISKSINLNIVEFFYFHRKKNKLEKVRENYILLNLIIYYYPSRPQKTLLHFKTKLKLQKATK